MVDPAGTRGYARDAVLKSRVDAIASTDADRGLRATQHD